MITFENTVDIARPMADVYAYVADFEHVPEWNWAVEAAWKETPGPVRVGTTFRQRRSVPRPAVDTLEVVAIDPGRSVEIVGPIGPFGARLLYEVSAAPTGARLINRVELEPPAPLGPLASIVGQRISREVAANLGALRDFLERRSD